MPIGQQAGRPATGRCRRARLISTLATAAVTSPRRDDHNGKSIHVQSRPMPTTNDAKSTEKLAAEMDAQAKTLKAEGKAKQKEAEKMLDAASRLESAAKALR